MSDNQALVHNFSGDEYHKPEPITVSPGDVWHLGDHVLYCGDTTDNEFKSIVDEYAPFTFGFADPPYGADVAEWDNECIWEHDYLSDICDVVAVTPGIVSIYDFALQTDMPYQWSIASWIKNGMARSPLGFGNWIYIALFADVDTSLYRELQDVIPITINTSDTDRTDHKGRKPSELMHYLINQFTQEGDTVIDPFAGSGTTLLVCERLNRTCITGELEPQFCEEIIERWNLDHYHDPAQEVSS
jgi:ParB family chromosome partitioning protein